MSLFSACPTPFTLPGELLPLQSCAYNLRYLRFINFFRWLISSRPICTFDCTRIAQPRCSECGTTTGIPLALLIVYACSCTNQRLETKSSFYMQGSCRYFGYHETTNSDKNKYREIPPAGAQIGSFKRSPVTFSNWLRVLLVTGGT